MERPLLILCAFLLALAGRHSLFFHNLPSDENLLKKKNHHLEILVCPFVDMFEIYSAYHAMFLACGVTPFLIQLWVFYSTSFLFLLPPLKNIYIWFYIDEIS